LIKLLIDLSDINFLEILNLQQMYPCDAAANLVYVIQSRVEAENLFNLKV